VGVRGLQRPAPHVQRNLGQWCLDSHKKRETKPWEGNTENTEVADSFDLLHSITAGIGSRDKMVCRYCLSNISGSQLFGHLSNIISQKVQFADIN
jgi:hypothetical protein